jgi:hypothetical protein
MTLLELIVGLSITGMSVTVGYGAVATLITNGDRAGQELDATLHAAAQRRALTQWLSGARLMIDESSPTFRGLDGVDQHRPSDDLSFLTTSPTPLGLGNTVVRLYVDRDTLTPERGLVAEFSRWPGVLQQRMEIDPRVDGLDCRYFTRMLNEAEWLPSWISNTILPGAVEVQLLPAPNDSLPQLLSLPLVVATGYDS